MKRPKTTAWLRSQLSDSAYACALITQLRSTRKSRKRKEYIRAFIRLAEQRSEEDFLYFTGKTVRDILHFKHTQI